MVDGFQFLGCRYLQPDVVVRLELENWRLPILGPDDIGG